MSDRPAGRGERVVEVLPALVTMRCRGSHQRATRGTQARTGHFRFRLKFPDQRLAPAIKFVAPSNRKRHEVSLRLEISASLSYRKSKSKHAPGGKLLLDKCVGAHNKAP